MSYSVAIVADPRFGDRLHDLAKQRHVWACATSENRRAAERYWLAVPSGSLEQGSTTFDVGEADPPEEMLLGVLAAVDLHHGEHSHTPPWDTREVYGTPPTPAVRRALAEFGVAEVVETPHGFRCTRPVDGAT